MPNRYPHGDIFQQGDPNDTRFQFEIIKSLSDNVRNMNETQVKMLERLARIEEHKVHEIVGELEARINALEQDRDRRDGASGVWADFLKWWAPITTVCGVIFTVLYLLLRAIGVINLPDEKPAPAPTIQAQPERVNDRPTQTDR